LHFEHRLSDDVGWGVKLRYVPEADGQEEFVLTPPLCQQTQRDNKRGALYRAAEMLRGTNWKVLRFTLAPS